MLGERAFPPARVTRAMAEFAPVRRAPRRWWPGRCSTSPPKGRQACAGRPSTACARSSAPTGALIAASLAVGGPGWGRPPIVLLGATIEAIGHDLGQAFQIADDLLNEHGDARALGKNAGTDRARGKATWHAAAGLPAPPPPARSNGSVRGGCGHRNFFPATGSGLLGSLRSCPSAGREACPPPRSRSRVEGVRNRGPDQHRHPAVEGLRLLGAAPETQLRRFVQTGGMPSAHDSASVTALSTAGSPEGWHSTLFGVAAFSRWW